MTHMPSSDARPPAASATAVALGTGADGNAGALDAPRIVLVDKRREMTSSSLAPEALQALQDGMRTGPWYLDHWNRPKFRAAMRQVRASAAPGGLIIIGPAMGFDPPAAFEEFFEPVPVSLWDTEADAQLRTLSGQGSTRQERAGRIVWGILGALGVLALFGGVWSIVATGSSVPAAVGAAIAVGIAAFVAGIVWLTRLGGVWYLVPGGVAVVRPLVRRDRRVQLLTRRECDLLLRWVHTGKTTVLLAELRELNGRVWRQSVSDRQAMGLLAAWQSRCPPPSLAQLRGILEVPA